MSSLQTVEPIFDALSQCASLFPSDLSDDGAPAFADADVNGHIPEEEDAEEETEVGAVRTLAGNERFTPY
jgi:hypothetical protein